MDGLDRIYRALLGGDVKEIEAAQTRALLESGRPPVVIDVRQPDEFRSGHIPGAVSWPLVGGGPPSPGWLSAEQLVVVCASGHRSIIGGRRLVKAGARRVASLRGGTAEWSAKGGPLAR